METTQTKSHASIRMGLIPDLNEIGKTNRKKIRDLYGVKNTKALIKLAQDEGVNLGKRKETQERRAYKYFGRFYNDLEEEFIRQDRAVRKATKERNKKISKALRIQQIAQPIDSAFRGKFEVYRLPLNLDIPKSKQQDKEYIQKLLVRKTKKQLKIFETRLRDRPVKINYGLEYSGFSEDKDKGMAHMSEMEGILEKYGSAELAKPHLDKKQKKYEEENTKTKNISSAPTIMLNSEQMWSIYLNHLSDLFNDMFKETYESILIKKLNHVDIFVTDYKPKIGTSFVELPAFIKNKKAIVNIKNDDRLCFIYSILAHKLQIKAHPERMSHYKDKLGQLKFNPEDYVDGVEVSSHKILHFEKANEMCVNIYGLIDNEVRPLRLSNMEYEDIVNLFYYEGHYTYIKSFPRFSGADGKNKHTCPRCLKTFSMKDAYESHVKECKNLGCNQRTFAPKKTETTFTGSQKQNKKPVVIYGDFEAINHKKNTHAKNGSMVKDTEHISASYRIFIQSEIPLSIPVDYEYVGVDANIHFVNTILSIEKELVQNIYDAKYKNKYVMKMTEEQKLHHKKCDVCRFCNKKVVDKVKDHDHYTGEYRGVACKDCNLQASCPKIETIPIYFHNLNYDLRQIINAFQSVKGAENITCIASNSENFKCLSLGRFKFVDTLAFLSTSLEKLIKNVPDEKKNAMRKITSDKNKFKMICKKGEFPYEWFDSFEKLNQPIPSREHFYNNLAQQELSSIAYDEMMKTCEVFGIKTFKEFHDLYLKRDVYGLCDVFEYFREISMEAYGLDPAHYIGLPSFAWDCMLKKTGVVLETIQDTDMYMFFEKGIRGGISKAVTRHVKANNKYVKGYDKSKPNEYLSYLDANNLYGWAMSKYLPCAGFEWVDANDLNNIAFLGHTPKNIYTYTFYQQD
jgi:hypothetical protein